MEEKVNGWVVVTYNHGFSGRKWMNRSTFASTRSKSIRLFIDGSAHSWKYWKRKFNFQCVKAISSITII